MGIRKIGKMILFGFLGLIAIGMVSNAMNPTSNNPLIGTSWKGSAEVNGYGQVPVTIKFNPTEMEWSGSSILIKSYVVKGNRIGIIEPDNMRINVKLIDGGEK